MRDNGPCGGRKPCSQAGKCGSKEAIDEVSISALPQWEPTAVARGSIQQIITISTTSTGRSVGCEHALLCLSPALVQSNTARLKRVKYTRRTRLFNHNQERRRTGERSKHSARIMAEGETDLISGLDANTAQLLWKPWRGGAFIWNSISA